MGVASLKAIISMQGLSPLCSLEFPNAAPIPVVASGEYGYLFYAQNGSSVQRRVSEIMPGGIVEMHEGKLPGHKGIQKLKLGGTGEALLVCGRV